MKNDILELNRLYIASCCIRIELDDDTKKLYKECYRLFLKHTTKAFNKPYIDREPTVHIHFNKNDIDSISCTFDSYSTNSTIIMGVKYENSTSRIDSEKIFKRYNFTDDFTMFNRNSSDKKLIEFSNTIEEFNDSIEELLRSIVGGINHRYNTVILPLRKENTAHKDKMINRINELVKVKALTHIDSELQRIYFSHCEKVEILNLDLCFISAKFGADDECTMTVYLNTGGFSDKDLPFITRDQLHIGSIESINGRFIFNDVNSVSKNIRDNITVKNINKEIGRIVQDALRDY